MKSRFIEPKVSSLDIFRAWRRDESARECTRLGIPTGFLSPPKTWCAVIPVPAPINQSFFHGTARKAGACSYSNNGGGKLLAGGSISKPQDIDIARGSHVQSQRSVVFD